MDGTYNALRRHAEKDLATIRQRLDSGKRMGVKETHRLADIAEKLTRTIENMDRREGRRPYSDTGIGYRADAARYEHADTLHDVMDAVNRILPHIADDFEWDADMRRGRPRTTRRGVGRWTQVRRHVRRMPGRSEMDDRYDMDDMDDMDDRYDRYDVDDRRGGSRRRDSRGRFRSDADDRYNTDDRHSGPAPVMDRTQNDETSDDGTRRPGPATR